MKRDKMNKLEITEENYNPIEFYNNIKGYISFDVDFFNNKDFKNIENKTYIELPTNMHSKIDMIEISDTENFIDFIDS